MITSESQKHSPLGLESIIATDVLRKRQTRAPNHVAENDALIALAEKMASSPNDILQKLAETALSLCHAQTCGISLLGSDETLFFWPALTGVWASHVGGNMPRGFSPCGTVLDRNAAQLMCHPERYFTYFAAVTPWIEEVLLVPFYAEGKAVGTIWVIVHDQSHRFDSEDLRIMTNLGTFAAAAYQTLQYLKTAKLANERLESEVQIRTRALQQLSAKLMRSQDEERRRIARDLHDSLGQDLTSIKMDLESLRTGDAPNIDAPNLDAPSPDLQTVALPKPDSQKITAPTREQVLSSALETIERSIVETRTLSSLLHPPLLDEVGFASAAHWYTDQFVKRSGIKVKLDLPDGVDLLPELARITLFRILQESLTNVHRHSGSAAAEVRLSASKDEVVFSVRDFGRGMPAELVQGSQLNRNRFGVGLSGMRERVTDLGGHLEIHSGKDGTAITVSIPLAA